MLKTKTNVSKKIADVSGSKEPQSTKVPKARTAKEILCDPDASGLRYLSATLRH